MISYLSLVIAIAIGVIGQLSLKEGALRSPSFASVVPVITNPFIWGGLVAYFVAALFYIYAIRQVPLSVAFPSVSISYVVVSILAHWIWKEPFGLPQLLALALIGGAFTSLAKRRRPPSASV